MTELEILAMRLGTQQSDLARTIEDAARSYENMAKEIRMYATRIREKDFTPQHGVDAAALAGWALNSMKGIQTNVRMDRILDLAADAKASEAVLDFAARIAKDNA